MAKQTSREPSSNARKEDPNSKTKCLNSKAKSKQSTKEREKEKKLNKRAVSFSKMISELKKNILNGSSKALTTSLKIDLINEGL